MKKIWIFLFASLLLIAGCSSGEKSNQGGSTEKKDGSITVWAWDPKFNIAAMKIAEKYYKESNSDFKLNIIENSQDDIVQKLNTGLSSGTTKGMPNIVLIEDYRAQSFLQAYPDAFFDISDYINTDDFAQYKISSSSYDGKQYGLPFDTGVTGLYLRKDYIEEAGYSLEDFQNITWEQFADMAIDIYKKTGKYISTNDPSDLGILRVMIQTAGSWYLEENGKTPNIADNKALKEAFQIYKKMVNAGIFKETTDWSQYVGALNSGEIVETATGNWITPSIKAEPSQSGKWAIAPIPRLSIDGSVNASNLGGSSWYILNVDGKEEAAKFLAETFGKNIDMYQELATEVGAIGTYIPATKGEAYQTADEFFGGQKTISDFTTWMEEVKPVNYGMHTYAIEDILANEMQKYLKGADLQEVLDDAQKQAEAQIK
ncbi:extracellular solute-binding protein [Caldibacillus sp. 210928-DFI.2.22]|uniref:ABC transporter substrate-binding protein n=1 Tax=unclassified Caldibacillus TaxID=2641266 RepID=UPI001D0715B7|nr:MULTISPECIES: extracellular solute-binding protein [unclassified Caldibacillus]MCB7070209.1 extracellular solute-binding protein [Caldibacillus sp. 210928-DFI.2.22]MCB7073673.1 extracellular solute-binding protein [Caldibacillus sp. 210928-DFI.2.18]